MIPMESSSTEVAVEEDDSVAINSPANLISWGQYVVYSPSFMVPGFYFIAWDQRMFRDRGSVDDF